MVMSLEAHWTVEDKGRRRKERCRNMCKRQVLKIVHKH